jgi:hypothetical protein
MVAQPTFGTPFNSPPPHRVIDPRSPLLEGIQTSPWPPSYKPITLPKFNGRMDPYQFIMSFEVAMASAGGNEIVLAKSFVIAADGDALAWYSMLRPSSVYLWEDLRDRIIANFKGFTIESLMSMDLFQCRQNQGEALRDYLHRFVQLKAKMQNVPKDVAIEAAIKGLRIRAFVAHPAREKPSAIQELCTKFEKYYRSDNDLRRRLEGQN